MKKKLIRLTNINDFLDKDKNLLVINKGDIVSPMVQDYAREHNIKVVYSCDVETENVCPCTKDVETTNKSLSEENIIFIVKYLGEKYGITDKNTVQKILKEVMKFVN